MGSCNIINSKKSKLKLIIRYSKLNFVDYENQLKQLQSDKSTYETNLKKLLEDQEKMKREQENESLGLRERESKLQKSVLLLFYIII
jgi:hypothetical protein